MKAGEIYMVYWPFPKPDTEGRTGKYRPALIILTHAGQAVAISVQITSVKKQRTFANRVEILHWQQAGLHKESWAEVAEVLPITLNASLKYVGKLTEIDFNRILIQFNRHHNLT